MFEQTLEGVVLQGIDNFQDYIRKQKILKERIQEDLINDGWKIEYGYEGEIFKRDRDGVTCYATKEVGEGKTVQFKRKARTYPGDVYIEELGELLSLARIYEAIKGV